MRIVIPSTLVALLLTSCTTQDIDSSTLLSRAMERVRAMQSAQVEGNLQVQGNSALAGGMTRIEAAFDGRIAEYGSQIDTAFDATIHPEQSPIALPVAGQLRVLSPQEVYIRITHLDPVIQMLVGSGAWTNHWFALPASSGATLGLSNSVSPDPSLLTMQEAAVVPDGTPKSTTLDATRVWELPLQIDVERLVTYLARRDEQEGRQSDMEALRTRLNTLQFSGTVWIERETYDVRRMRWTVESTEEAMPMRAVFDVKLSRINDAGVIVPPEDALPLPQQNVPDSQSRASSLVPFPLLP